MLLRFSLKMIGYSTAAVCSWMVAAIFVQSAQAAAETDRPVSSPVTQSAFALANQFSMQLPSELHKTMPIAARLDNSCAPFKGRNRIVAMKTVPILVNSDDPRFAAAKIAAYRRALAAAQIDSLLMISQTILANTTDQLSSSQDSIGGTLESEFTQKSTVSAFGAIAGMTVLHSFSGIDDFNQPAVAVCTVAAPDLALFSSGIQLQNNQDEARQWLIDSAIMDRNSASLKPVAIGNWINQLLPKQLTEFVGVRLFTDQDGNPALVVFGQAVNGYSGSNKKIREKYRTLAIEAAQAVAESILADYFAGAIQFSQDSMQQQLIEVAAIGTANESEAIDRMQSLASQWRSAVNTTITNAARLRVWHEEMKYQFGIVSETVGVVLIWKLPVKTIH